MNGPHRHVQFPGNKIGAVLVFQTITIQSSKRFMLEHFIKQKPLILLKSEIFTYLPEMECECLLFGLN